MKTPILETERLILREMTREDYPALAAILQDAETMHAYEHAFSDEETRAWLERQLRRYQEDGFGLWAVVLRETGRMIGQCGITLQALDGNMAPEIGYHFNRQFWHRGYAIEAAAACKRHAFTTLGFDEVHSIIRDTNLASINVAIRNGMFARRWFVKNYRGVDMTHIVFSATDTATRGFKRGQTTG